MCEICSKLTIETPERRQWRCFGVFIVNREKNLTLCSSVSIVNFEQVNAGWLMSQIMQLRLCLLRRLGLYRDAEKQLKSALRDEEIVDIFLYLAKVYVKLDQPLTAIEVFLKVTF